MHNIADDARNTFVGISRKSVDKHWRIGYQATGLKKSKSTHSVESWGFRGLDGSVYYGYCITIFTLTNAVANQTVTQNRFTKKM